MHKFKRRDERHKEWIEFRSKAWSERKERKKSDMIEWLRKDLWVLCLSWCSGVVFLTYKCFVDFSPLTGVCLIITLSTPIFIFLLSLINCRRLGE